MGHLYHGDVSHNQMVNPPFTEGGLPSHPCLYYRATLHRRDTKMRCWRCRKRSFLESPKLWGGLTIKILENLASICEHMVIYYIYCLTNLTTVETLCKTWKRVMYHSRHDMSRSKPATDSMLIIFFVGIARQGPQYPSRRPNALSCKS